MIHYCRGLRDSKICGTVNLKNGTAITFNHVSAVIAHRKKPPVVTVKTFSGELTTIIIDDIMGFSFDGSVLGLAMLKGPK